MRSTKKILIIFLIFVCAGIIPYWIAYLSQGDDKVFSGLLLNPWDGNTYLAKMYQGWQGSWTYQLPYTAEPGTGSFLYIFYLFIGHLSRWLAIDPIIIYHLFRIFGGAILGVSLYRLVRKYVPEEDCQFKAWVLGLFGSGLGWLFFLFLGMTSDFWVAETYPLLSTLTNPHFPITIALVLEGFLSLSPPIGILKIVKWMVLGLLIAVLSPFGIAVLGSVLIIQTIWSFVEERKVHLQPLIGLGVGAVPYLGYLVWLYLNHPQIAAWQEQNLTPTPRLPDLIISLSPAFIFAVAGVYGLWKKSGNHPGRKLWISWFLVGGILIFIPFSLQRRLLIGYYVPTAILAVEGLSFLFKQQQRLFNRLYFILLLSSIPTSVILFSTLFYGIQTKDPMLYLSTAENKALEWIANHTEEDSVILASPEMGMFIASQTGRLVLYGHPFETPNAEDMLRLVEDVFAGRLSEEDLHEILISNRVDYLFYGPREKNLAAEDKVFDYPVVYQDGDVMIYSIGR